jgi:uncharacterized protein YgbK (DUF1537 family)
VIPLTQRRLLVLDDDPTGTQLASDIPVLLSWDSAGLENFFSSPHRAAFVLTNTRAVDRDTAVSIVEEIRDRCEAIAARRGMSVGYVLRGDSTLRGHVVAEIEALATDHTIVVFCPAYVEAGRVTVAGRHELVAGASRVPMDQTEYARDATFGYSTSQLERFLADAGCTRPVLLASLADVRSESLFNLLGSAPPGAVVVPDALDAADIERIAAAVERLQKQGVPVLVRCAASLATRLAGSAPKPVDSLDIDRNQGGVLFVSGSHTSGATAQLDRLAQWIGPAAVVTMAEVFGPWRSDAVERHAARLARALDRDGWACVTTERQTDHVRSGLADGAVVMEALCSVVEAVADRCAAVVAKGGITSAEVAKSALRARSATVVGQLSTGVPVWSLSTPRGALPYVVCPGNIGDRELLVDVARKLGLPVDVEHGTQI